jgi:phosphoribosylformimino-5-aminoimidazole carboxamide ribotide isomerase
MTGTGFTPIPAIDIRGGRCVRLVHGNFSRETIYGDDPVAMARHWQAEGATRLHVVDLDGARSGQRANADVIRRICGAMRIPVQVGGGIRDELAARQVLDAGADRVIIGTAALQESLQEWLQHLDPDQLIVSIDARDGMVATHGWLKTTSRSATNFARELASLGVVRVLYTDISRDGTLAGPNIEATRALVEQTRLRVLASGGVSTPADLAALAEAGAEGAIIGTALYEGRLRLKDLVAC